MFSCRTLYLAIGYVAKLWICNASRKYNALREQMILCVGPNVAMLEKILFRGRSTMNLLVAVIDLCAGRCTLVLILQPFAQGVSDIFCKPALANHTANTLTHAILHGRDVLVLHHSLAHETLANVSFTF